MQYVMFIQVVTFHKQLLWWIFRDLLGAQRRSILTLLQYEHPEKLFNRSN